MSDHSVTGELVDRLKPDAARASGHAHAPYSGFLVGAALETKDGRRFAACNVESASYGLTQCAERNALGSAVADGVRPGEVTGLVIYLPGNEPLPPCGACRQVMAELMAPGAPVVACCDGERLAAWTIDQLLPDAFRGR